MIKINFEDIFEPLEVSEDRSFTTFYSTVTAGEDVLIKVEIAPLSDPLLPDVYNLAFGPLNNKGGIDDTANVSHRDIGKMFSTVLSFALFFLRHNTNPNISIGLDGSNDVRAYLYHRMFQTNRTHLDEFFSSIGVDWYVRLLRNQDIERDEDGNAFFKPRPEPFDYKRANHDLYRYYMFKLKKQAI